MCLPHGIWAWPVGCTAELTEAALSPVLDCSPDLDFFVLGTGIEPWVMPETLRQKFRQAGVSADTMTTDAAVRTYNVMLMESRRIGAGLIAID